MYVGVFVAFIVISFFLMILWGQLYAFALVITVVCVSPVRVNIY